MGWMLTLSGVWGRVLDNLWELIKGREGVPRAGGQIH
jgi:hypothetical protein